MRREWVGFMACEDRGLHLSCNGKSLKGLKKRGDMVKVTLARNSWLLHSH